MNATAGRASDAPEASPIRTFLTIHRTRSILVATLFAGSLAAWLGTLEVSVPTMGEQGQGRIPMWRLVAMGAASLPVLALHSNLGDLEQVVTRQLRHLQRRYLAGMCLGCAAIYLGLASLTLDPLVIGIIARSWLAWFGLALLAGALLGWRLAWTLPATVAVVLWYWGYRGSGHYRWWEFSARPHDDLPSLLLSVALLATGLAAYWATPWRRRRPRRTPRRNPERSGKVTKTASPR